MGYLLMLAILKPTPGSTTIFMTFYSNINKEIPTQKKAANYLPQGNWLLSTRVYSVGELVVAEGFEPSIPKAEHFKCSMYTSSITLPYYLVLFLPLYVLVKA